jgi:hypothetical protein
MWLFTKTRFYSIIIDNQRAGRMLIRSRCKADAANLYRDHHKELASMEPPTSDESRDYRWRISISPGDWLKLATRLADQIDYSNFKSEVHKRADQANKTAPYHEVWATMARLQWEEPTQPATKRKARRLQKAIKPGEKAEATSPTG